MMRGTTLIELMIVVALIGISSLTAGSAASWMRNEGLGALQRERAAELLEYEAERLSSGQPIVAATVTRLTESLPGARVVQQRLKGATELTIEWIAPGGGHHTRALVVFTPRGAR